MVRRVSPALAAAFLLLTAPLSAQPALAAADLDFHVQQRARVVARSWDFAVVQGYSTLDKRQPGDPTELVRSAGELAELLRNRNPDVDVRLMATAWGKR